MDLKTEFEAIMSELKQAINGCLEGEISAIAGECIRSRVDSDVYPMYSPTQYIRRKGNGGIADPLMYVYNVDTSSHTLTVGDNRPEVSVVESGVGYTWEDSMIYRMQPYPRPYFPKADEDIQTNGEADAALERAIQSI